MSDNLIKLDNEGIEFKIDNCIYKIDRVSIQEEFSGIYWMAADLYRIIIDLYNKDKKWFDKYRV